MSSDRVPWRLVPEKSTSSISGTLNQHGDHHQSQRCEGSSILIWFLRWFACFKSLRAHHSLWIPLNQQVDFSVSSILNGSKWCRISSHSGPSDTDRALRHKTFAHLVASFNWSKVTSDQQVPFKRETSHFLRSFQWRKLTAHFGATDRVPFATRWLLSMKQGRPLQSLAHCKQAAEKNLSLSHKGEERSPIDLHWAKAIATRWLLSMTQRSPVTSVRCSRRNCHFSSLLSMKKAHRSLWYHWAWGSCNSVASFNEAEIDHLLRCRCSRRNFHFRRSFQWRKSHRSLWCHWARAFRNSVASFNEARSPLTAVPSSREPFHFCRSFQWRKLTPHFGATEREHFATRWLLSMKRGQHWLRCLPARAISMLVAPFNEESSPFTLGPLSKSHCKSVAFFQWSEVTTDFGAIQQEPFHFCRSFQWRKLTARFGATELERLATPWLLSMKRDWHWLLCRRCGALGVFAIFPISLDKLPFKSFPLRMIIFVTWQPSHMDAWLSPQIRSL